MSYRTHAKKPVVKSTTTPSRISLLSRPFSLQAKATEAPDIESQLKRAERLGHNFGQIRVTADGLDSNSLGRPLPKPLREKMERALGHDFSNIRVHEDNSAASIGALAYTRGNDIHFMPNVCQPNSISGQKLIGHELTHIIQQRQGRVMPTTQANGLPINNNSTLEHEADSKGTLAVFSTAQKKTAYDDAEEISNSQANTNSHAQPTQMASGIRRGHNFSNRAVTAAPRTNKAQNAPIQLKKTIRNGRIVEVDDDEPTPLEPFPGKGRLLRRDKIVEVDDDEPTRFVRSPGTGHLSGRNSRAMPGTMMVSKTVAKAVTDNILNSQPHFRPELGEVGRVSWLTTEGNPHTGTQKDKEGEEPKDVPLNVELNIPNVPTPTSSGQVPQVNIFTNEKLIERLERAPEEIRKDPIERAEAEKRLRKAQIKKIDDRFEGGIPTNSRKKFNELIRRGKTKEEAREALLEEEYSRIKIPESALRKIPDPVLERHMWSRLGENTRATSSGITLANVGQGRLSRQGSGQFALVAHHARHYLRLRPVTRATLLRKRMDAERMEEEYAENLRRNNEFLKWAHFERLREGRPA